jgi:hypothetical protein
MRLTQTEATQKNDGDDGGDAENASQKYDKSVHTRKSWLQKIVEERFAGKMAWLWHVWIVFKGVFTQSDSFVGTCTTRHGTDAVKNRIPVRRVVPDGKIRNSFHFAVRHNTT